MFKKFNILLILLLISISLAAVSAADDADMNVTSNEVNLDTVSVDTHETLSSEYTIDSSNYNNYFDSNGNLKDNVNSGDTIKLSGSFSNKNFTFNKTVNVIGQNSNKFTNSMFKFLSGASGSTVSSLNIANKLDETYGIFLNGASNCIISGCTIYNEGKSSYPICLGNGANYNNVTSNVLKTSGETYGHGSRSTPALLLSGSHHNNLISNHIEVDDANAIYLSSYNGGPLKGGDSNYNLIFNNTVKYNVLPTSWSWGIQIMGSSNTIKSNKVIGAYRGITTTGYYNTIVENQIINLTGADYNSKYVEVGGEYGIVGSKYSIVSNNQIINAKIISTGSGISVIDESVVENNHVDVKYLGMGISAEGYNVIVKNNNISTASGVGIHEKDERSGLTISNNNITSQSGMGILIEKVSSKRMPSNVTITYNDIITSNEYAIDASGVEEGSGVIENNNVHGKKILLPSGIYDGSKPTYKYDESKTYTVTPENIGNYITPNGNLMGNVEDGSILKFQGTFTNQVIHVNKAIKLLGNKAKFLNSTFKVTSGNVWIENLTIINKNAERLNAWGIYVNQAPGVKIVKNHIEVTDPNAAYAIYVLESTYVEVINNTLISDGDFLTYTLLVYSSEDCIFTDNEIRTIGTGEKYRYSPESPIEGKVFYINGTEYCVDGNEFCIDGVSYCIDGNEVCIDGVTYCIDGNEVCIDGVTYCIDGNEVCIDGINYCLDGGELCIDGVSYCLDGNELKINGASYIIIDKLDINGTTYSINGTKFLINNTEYCIDGNEFYINGVRYCLGGIEVCIDGVTYCLDGNELKINGVSYTIVDTLVINGTTYSINGTKFLINGTEFCLDGNELCIDGVTYCLDGNELVINGTAQAKNNHVVPEIYRTYGILLLYSSSNQILRNNVNVTSKLNQTYPTTGVNASENSIVGIDIYYNSHNNTVCDNEVFISARDNYIYGVGVLGHQSGHPAPEGQGATNNKFISNTITLIGQFATTGIIIGDESQKTLIDKNIVNIISDVTYGINLEGSDNSTIKNNIFILNSQVAYGIEAYNSYDNVVDANNIDASGKQVYGMIFSGNNNMIKNNIIIANGSGEKPSFVVRDSFGSGNAGICLYGNATNNTIQDNNITSQKGYAVVSQPSGNTISDNCLKSEKGNCDAAVNATLGNTVKNNYIYTLSGAFDPVEIPYLGSGDLILRVQNPDGISLDGAVVSFFNDNNTWIGNATVLGGVATLKYQLDESYDSIGAQYLIKAILYKPNFKVTTFESYNLTVVKGNLNIAVSNVSVKDGMKAKLTATITDGLGKPVSGVTIKFYNFDTGNKQAWGSGVTDENGTATISYFIDKNFGEIFAKVTNITASVSESSYYSASNATGLLTILDIAPITININSKVSYSGVLATIVDNNGFAVANKDVSLSIDGKTQNVKTNANGEIILNSLSSGLHTVVVSSAKDSNYDANSSTSKVTVVLPISENKNINTYFGNTALYKLRLADKDGNYLGANVDVVIKVNGKSLKYRTNSDGYVYYSVKKVGTYTITAEYNGYKVSNKVVIKPTLSAKNISKKKAKKIKFSVKVVNKNGKVVKKKTVTFKIKNKKYTAKTNNKGVATVTLKKLKVGKHTISSSYGGCTIKNTIKIKK